MILCRERIFLSLLIYCIVYFILFRILMKKNYSINLITKISSVVYIFIALIIILNFSEVNDRFIWNDIVTLILFLVFIIVTIKLCFKDSYRIKKINNKLRITYLHGRRTIYLVVSILLYLLFIFGLLVNEFKILKVSVIMLFILFVIFSI